MRLARPMVLEWAPAAGRCDNQRRLGASAQCPTSISPFWLLARVASIWILTFEPGKGMVGYRLSQVSIMVDTDFPIRIMRYGSSGS